VSRFTRRSGRLVAGGLGLLVFGTLAGFTWVNLDTIVERWYMGKLQSDDPAVRDEALEKLAERESTRAARWLRGRLLAERQRLHAAHPRLPSPLQFARTADDGMKSVWWNDVWPATALVRMGPAGAREIVELFGEPDQVVLDYARDAIVCLGADAVPALVIGTRGPSPTRRSWCAFLLEWLGEDATPAVQDLVHLLADPHVVVREHAVSALCELDRTALEPAMPLLEELAESDDNSISRAAREVLESTPKVTPPAGSGVPILPKQPAIEIEAVEESSPESSRWQEPAGTPRPTVRF